MKKHKIYYLFVIFVTIYSFHFFPEKRKNVKIPDFSTGFDGLIFVFLHIQNFALLCNFHITVANRRWGYICGAIPADFCSPRQNRR